MPSEWDPGKLMEEAGPRVTVRIGERDVRIRAWRYVQQSPTGGKVPLYFLDTDLAGNASADREITDQSYGSDPPDRFAPGDRPQVRGRAHARGPRVSDTEMPHMNGEAFGPARPRSLHRHGLDEERSGNGASSPTHTPIEAGHDRFGYDLVDDLIRDKTDGILVRKYGGEEELNMTILALNLSRPT